MRKSRLRPDIYAGHLEYRVRLLPENPGFDPIELDLRSGALAIEGPSVGVLRLRT